MVTLILEGRTLDKRELTMRRVDEVVGGGFAVAVPSGWLLIEDERIQAPVGGVALARPGKDSRATIVIAPYPDDTDQLYSDAGCQTVAKLHAKQVGAQLVDARFEPQPKPRCLAQIDEGPQVTGTMELQRIGPRSIMVTCRYSKGSDTDRNACSAISAGLQPR
jgi:hypothetical protein